MAKLEVFDTALCCPTGVCGPVVDSAVVRFAADLKWLEGQGVEVRRFNLSQNPAAYVENEAVRGLLTEKGEAALPACLVDGQVVLDGRYPEREELEGWLGL